MPGGNSLRDTLIPGAVLAVLSFARIASAQTEIADMREDIRGLSQRLGELSLRVEQLEHENAELKSKVASLSGSTDSVTTQQLNGAIADLNASIKAAVDASRAQILQQVGSQMENLAKQTNAALDSLAKPGTPVVQARASGETEAPKGAFGSSYPKEGISYTVLQGDSVGLIAKKTGAKSKDIIDANRLADPSRIQAGQVLFIPGGK